MEVKVVNGLENKSWDNFVAGSNNGTIFHQLKFLQYHPAERFNFYNLIFHEDNNIVAVLPGALKDGVFKSPMGASYGSFVVPNIAFKKYEELVDTFLDFADKSKIKEIFLTPPPFFYMHSVNEIERFMLVYKGFEVKYHLISNCVNIAAITSSEELLHSFTPMHRRAVNKATSSGVKVAFSDDYAAYYEMLLENKKKFNATPTHTLEEMKKIKELFPDQVKLLLAYDSMNKLIAGLWLFKCNRDVLLMFYISHYYEFQELRAVNKLYYEALLWAKEQNITWVDLGVSMDTSSENPMEPSRNLIFFKEGINTRGFLRTTYHLKL